MPLATTQHHMSLDRLRTRYCRWIGSPAPHPAYSPYNVRFDRYTCSDRCIREVRNVRNYSSNFFTSKNSASFSDEIQQVLDRWREVLDQQNTYSRNSFYSIILFNNPTLLNMQRLLYLTNEQLDRPSTQGNSRVVCILRGEKTNLKV